MTDCEWKGGCVSAATRRVGLWQVCAPHFRAALESIHQQAADSSRVRTWVDRQRLGDRLDDDFPRPPIRNQRPDPNAALVYFARREELIKIGISSNVPKRMSELSRGSSALQGTVVGPVQLLGTVAGGRRREAQLHEQFAHLNVGLEWFRAAEDLIRWIATEAAQ